MYMQWKLLIYCSEVTLKLLKGSQSKLNFAVCSFFLVFKSFKSALVDPLGLFYSMTTSLKIEPVKVSSAFSPSVTGSKKEISQMYETINRKAFENGKKEGKDGGKFTVNV